MFGNVFVLDYTKANNAKVLIIKRYGNKKSKRLGCGTYLFDQEKMFLHFNPKKEDIPIIHKILDTQDWWGNYIYIRKNNKYVKLYE